MLLTKYHIQLTLNYANGTCRVCGRYHMTDGRYHEVYGSSVYYLQSCLLPQSKAEYVNDINWGPFQPNLSFSV